MRSIWKDRTVPLAAVLGTVIAALGFFAVQSARPYRHFMPGELGRETERVRSRVFPRLTPSAPNSTQPPLSAQAFVTRNIGLRTGEEQEWGRRNGLTAGIPFSHALDRVFPAEQLWDKHPEFFPLVGGKRYKPAKGAYNWNPDLGREDVARYAAQQARRYFDEHPDAVSFGLGVNDGLVFGDSAETLRFIQPQRWFRGRPDYSPLVFTFMNRVAEEVARTHPDKYLGCLAYYWCENVPPFSVHPQVIPFYTADRSQSYDPAFRSEEREMLRRWGDMSRFREARTSTFRAGPAPRLGMYDYLDGFGFVVPRVPIRAFVENIQYARSVGFTDYYGESSRNWGIDGPMPWVIAQILSRPDQDLEALLDEYYASFFKEAAGPMQRFFERCEEQWMKQEGPSYWLKHYRNESQAKVFPSSVCGELRRLLDEAATATGSAPVDTPHSGAVTQPSTLNAQPVTPFALNLTQPKAEPSAAVRVAFVSESFGVTERFVVFEEARAALATAVLKNELQGEALAAALEDYLRKRSDFIRYTVALRAKWPLAFYPINYDDFLRNDPAFAATFALAQAAVGRASPHPAADGSAAVGRASPHPAAISQPSTLNSQLPAAHASHRGDGRELLQSGSFEGPVQPGWRIAGLQYSMDLPGPWQSKVEPTETGVAILLPLEGAQRGTGARLARIEGAVNTSFYQWVPAEPGKLYTASVRARGRVSPSDAVTLTIGWLDAQHRRVGKQYIMRLPDGDWPEFVTLRQGGYAPENAAWVGISVKLMNQLPGDWAEFTAASLKSM